MSDAPPRWCGDQRGWGRARLELFTEEAVIVGPTRLATAARVCELLDFAAGIDLIDFAEFDHRIDRFGRGWSITPTAR